MPRPTVPLEYGLYGILTDPVIGYEAMAEVMVACGLRFVQLRMKGAPVDIVRALAARLREIVPRGGASWFIVNDYPELARDVGADGVHLGQADMPYERARALLGPGSIIGLSTHNRTETRDAIARKPDYIGVGPVFPTPTKANPDPVIGTAGMGGMLAIADEAGVSAVALGGITPENVAAVAAGGARNVCPVRAVNRASDADAAAATIRALETVLARSRAAGRPECS